jgi:hypothetical protein
LSPTIASVEILAKLSQICFRTAYIEKKVKEANSRIVITPNIGLIYTGGKKKGRARRVRARRYQRHDVLLESGAQKKHRHEPR